MTSKNNLPYYFATISIFILLKLGFKFTNDNESVLFLLKPINKMVEFLTGTQSVYSTESGYFFSQLNVFIDRSCSGFNFWVLSFIMLAFLGIKNLRSHLQKLLVLPVALCAAYLLTIIENTSRIFGSLVIQNQTRLYFADHQHTIHEGIGIISSLSFLILAYLITDKLLTQRNKNAQLT